MPHLETKKVMPYCGECRQECDVEWEDVGIGAYEYWGATYSQVSYVPMSSCCGADVFDDEECTIPFSEEYDPYD